MWLSFGIWSMSSNVAFHRGLMIVFWKKKKKKTQQIYMWFQIWAEFDVYMMIHSSFLICSHLFRLFAFPLSILFISPSKLWHSFFLSFFFWEKQTLINRFGISLVPCPQHCEATFYVCYPKSPKFLILLVHDNQSLHPPNTFEPSPVCRLKLSRLSKIISGS